MYYLNKTITNQFCVGNWLTFNMILDHLAFPAIFYCLNEDELLETIILVICKMLSALFFISLAVIFSEFGL